MNLRPITALTLVGLALVSTSGCARLEKRFTPAPKIVTVEATRAAGGAPVEGTLAPETPEDLPLWPGATVVESTTVDDAYSLTLQTADPYVDVLNGVAAGFEDADWKVAREEAGEEGSRTAILSVSTDGEEGIVTLTQLEDGSTQIDYVIAPSSK